MPKSKDNVNFEVRYVFKDTKAIDFNKVTQTTKDDLADLMKLNITEIKVKRYGLLFIGNGPIREVLRRVEAMYPMTADGGLDIIVHIGKNEAIYMKEGCIHDLRDGNVQVTLPKFDDNAEPDESELDRVGL